MQSQLGLVTPFFHIEDGGPIKQEAAPVQQGMPGTGPALQYFCVLCQKFVTPKEVTDDRKAIKVKVAESAPADKITEQEKKAAADAKAKLEAEAKAKADAAAKANPPGIKTPTVKTGPQAPPASTTQAPPGAPVGPGAKLVG